MRAGSSAATLQAVTSQPGGVKTNEAAPSVAYQCDLQGVVELHVAGQYRMDWMWTALLLSVKMDR